MKESLEVIELFKGLADSLKAAKADGQINWMDLPKFAPIIAKARAAVEGADKLPGEFKAATPDELVAFTEQALAAALALVAAVIEK